MEKFNYYFNTRARIDAALSVDVNKATMPSILFNLVWDAYYNISKDEDVIVKYIVDWMRTRTNIFHLSSYAKTIKNNIRKMKDMPWRNVTDTVKIRQSELSYISSFDDIKKEKLLFCYLAIAKFNDMSRKCPNHWENESDITVFKMARLNIPASKRDYFIYDLINEEPKAAIYLNFKNDDISKRIDYISDDESDPVVLELDESNYYELAFTYLNWKNGGGFKKCKKCGRLFKITGKNSQYCGGCKPKYETMYKNQGELPSKDLPKEKQCEDCGEVFYVDARNNTKCKCDECYSTHRRKNKTETMRRLRENS